MVAEAIKNLPLAFRLSEIQDLMEKVGIKVWKLTPELLCLSYIGGPGDDFLCRL